jgi:hypothetical protein
MILEKFILSVYMKNYRQVAAAKKHFMGSVRELLIAATYTADVVGRVTDQTPLVKHFTPLKQSVTNFQNVLKFTVRKMDMLGPVAQGGIDGVRTQILEGIMSVLDDELASIPRQSGAKQQMKADALLSVKKALLNHLATDSEELEPGLPMARAAND